jgi:hypothetical protein
MPKKTTYFVFLFCNYSFKFLGTHNTPLERCFEDLSNGILQAPKFQKSQLIKPKENLQSFSDCKAGWSKELQWENKNVLYKCIEGNWGICLLLAMFTGENWMVNFMIIYIKKIIAKAILMISSKTLWGCKLNESKSLDKLSNLTTR